MPISFACSGTQLMAQHPSFPDNDNDFGEDFPGFVPTKSEAHSPPPICITHHGPDLTRNVRDTDIRLDDLTPDIGGVTTGTHGRNSSVESGNAIVMATSALGIATVLQGPSRLVAQFPPPLSSTKSCVTWTGVWDVKQETVTTPSPEQSSTSQVKQDLCNLITARQPQPSTSKGHETREGQRNPTHIQSVSYPLQTLKDARRHFGMISASCTPNHICTPHAYGSHHGHSWYPYSVHRRDMQFNIHLVILNGLKFSSIPNEVENPIWPPFGDFKPLES